jgi:TonB family protein
MEYDFEWEATMQFPRLVFAAAAVLGCSSAADFSGRWVGAIDTNGSPIPFFLTVSHQESRIVGLVATGSEAKQTPIERPHAEGDNLTFEVPDNAGRVVQFRLSMAGGSITGESTVGGQTSKVSLSRGGGIGIGVGGGGFRSPLPVEGSRPGVYRVGGGVTAPALIYKTEPEYTEEARHAKYQGTVLLYVEIEPTGMPTNIKVQRSLGLGLDQKAVEAVQKWRFKPGMKDGNPVTVQATIEVNFRL